MGKLIQQMKTEDSSENPLSDITGHQYRTPRDKNRLDYFKII